MWLASIPIEKDPYPIDALPTCNHALAVCQQSSKCIDLFESFKTHCKVRENKCRMEDKYVSCGLDINCTFIIQVIILTAFVSLALLSCNTS